MAAKFDEFNVFQRLMSASNFFHKLKRKSHVPAFDGAPAVTCVGAVVCPVAGGKADRGAVNNAARTGRGEDRCDREEKGRGGKDTTPHPGSETKRGERNRERGPTMDAERWPGASEVSHVYFKQAV